MPFSSSFPVTWRLLATACAAFVPALAAAASATHCQADERPYFSCVAGKKTVSLCGAVSAGGISKLTYRYGKPGKVELEFAATSASAPHFMATVEPDSPRAKVSEVWFDRGEFRYLLHTCEGGDCPYDAGLAVLRGQRLLSNARCQRDADAVDIFSTDLVEFGDSTDTSKSHTKLLEIGDYTNSIDRLYPIPAKAYP